MSDQLIEYRSVLHRNEEVFLLKYKEEFEAFGITDQYFDRFQKIISTRHMSNGKSLVGLLPALLIMQRQYRNAFYSISVFQSYQAWVLLRPAIELALMMGKWLDDLSNVDAWKAHQQNWKKYLRLYRGKNLVSSSLPDSENIQMFLKRINDDYMHPTPTYYTRHTRATELDHKNVEIFVNYTDEESDHKAHTYSFLHVTLYILKRVGEMLSEKYGDLQAFEVNIQRLQAHFIRTVQEIASKNKIHKKVLLELGLWSNDELKTTAESDS